MEREELRASWDGLAAGVEQELVAWRATHPKATLAEIEAAVQEALRALQARYMTTWCTPARPRTCARRRPRRGPAARAVAGACGR